MPTTTELPDGSPEGTSCRSSDSERATTTELIDLVPSATTPDEFILKVCAGVLTNLLDGLSRLLVWYAHNSTGRFVTVTASDLDSEYVRMPGAVGELLRAVDPRTLAIVTHMMSHYLNHGDSIDLALKRVIDEAYLAYCQIG